MSTRTVAQLQAELAEAKKKELAQKAEYKEMVDKSIETLYPQLISLSEQMLKVKNVVYDEFATVLALKEELYGYKAEQQSHTFTTSDGSVSITIGHRVMESYDDTLDAGIAKVKEYLATLAKDDNSAMLVQAVMRLLSKDRKGNIKASRVVELDNIAQEVGDPLLIEGINIIKQSYRAQRTKQFIQVSHRDETGEVVPLPLSITQLGE